MTEERVGRRSLFTRRRVRAIEPEEPFAQTEAVPDIVGKVVQRDELNSREIAHFGRVMLDAMKNKLRRRQPLAVALFSDPDSYRTKSFRGGSIEKKKEKVAEGHVDRYKYTVVGKNPREIEVVTIDVAPGGRPVSIASSFREFEGDPAQTKKDSHMAYQRGLGIIGESRP